MVAGICCREYLDEYCLAKYHYRTAGKKMSGRTGPLNPLTWSWMVVRPRGEVPPGRRPDCEAAVAFMFTSNAWINSTAFTQDYTLTYCRNISAHQVIQTLIMISFSMLSSGQEISLQLKTMNAPQLWEKLHKFLHLSKKVHMGMHHFQHVGCDLIQVRDTANIHGQQWPLTLKATWNGSESHIVTKSRALRCSLLFKAHV